MSSFSIQLSNPLVTLPKAPIPAGTTFTCHIPTFFLSLSSNLDIFRHFLILFLLSFYQQTQQFPHNANSLFLINYSDIWPPCLGHIVTLFIYVPETFGAVIFYGIIWNVVIPLFLVLYFLLLTQIPNNLLNNIILPSLILFMSKFFISSNYKLNTLSQRFFLTFPASLLKSSLELTVT